MTPMGVGFGFSWALSSAVSAWLLADTGGRHTIAESKNVGSCRYSRYSWMAFLLRGTRGPLAGYSFWFEKVGITRKQRRNVQKGFCVC